MQACETMPYGLKESLRTKNFSVEEPQSKVSYGRLEYDTSKANKATFNPNQFGFDANKLTPKIHSRLWIHLVKVYSKCQLTQEKDKLIAISGLARRMKLSFKVKYLAGLWYSYLDLQLLWSVGDSNNRAPSRPRSYVAPTWSWASIVVGSIDFPNFDEYIFKGEGRFMIQDARVETIDGHEMSSAVNGYLHVVGRLIPVHVDYLRGSWFISSGGNIAAKDSKLLKLNPDIPSEMTGGTYYCMHMLRIPWGLLLKDGGNKKGQFKRVGIYKGFHEPEIREERNLIAENLYEKYDEATNMYTFTIV